MKFTSGSENRKNRAIAMVKKYATGGAIDKTGEPDDCPTKNNPTCKKSGGAVAHAKGEPAKKRLDKPKRYASGGGIEESPKKKGSAKTEVNIVIAGKGDDKPAMSPMGMPASTMPSSLPVGGPPPAAGMVPPKPPGVFKRGGKVEYPIDAGSGGGKGRLEKAAAQKMSDPRKGGKK